MFRKAVFVLLILSSFLSFGAFSDESLLSIPVQVRSLTSDVSSKINPDISRADLDKVFDTVNVIWKQAGIEFYMDSYHPLSTKNENSYIKGMDKDSKLSKKQRSKILRQSCSSARGNESLLTLCVVGKMANPSLAGVFFKKPYPLVAWPTKTRNGPNPATLAHEFGHSLGLRHNSEDDIYLMRGAGNNSRRKGRFTSIKLTKAEIITARKIAEKFIK